MAAAKIAAAEASGAGGGRQSAQPSDASGDWGFGTDDEGAGGGGDGGAAAAVRQVGGGGGGGEGGEAAEVDASGGADMLDWLVGIGHADEPPVGAVEKGNKIKTSIYTWWNFIPLNLYFQFHRFANWFFLVMSLINFVPQIRTFAPALSFLPLLLVLIAQAVIDIVEDRRRHRSDFEVNNKESTTVNPLTGELEMRRWADIRIGDIVKLESGDAIPADLLLLHTSDPSGVAFVDTSNLDGETNLKARSIFYERDTGSNGTSVPPFDMSGFDRTVHCERPNVKIYSFNGFIEHAGSRVVLGADNLLLRDCILRNTGEVYGVVVYAGHQSKAMLNNTGPRHKVTKLERKMNHAVIYCVGLLILMSIFGAIMCYYSYTRFDQNEIIFDEWAFKSQRYDASLDSFERFWTWVVILQALVPLALYVSVVYVKFFQVFFVNSDVELYDPLTDTPMNCRALNLTEDLGQIQHVFCDKTGTLTQNVMIFRCCSVAGSRYDHGFQGLSEFDPNERAAARDPGMVAALKGKPGSGSSSSKGSGGSGGNGGSGSGSSSKDSSGNGGTSGSGSGGGDKPSELRWDTVDQASPEHDALMCLVLCNTARPVVPDELAEAARDPKGVRAFEHGELRFEAESPDEVALIDAALAYGYAFSYTDIYNKTIRVGGEARVFRVLATLEFDATRKCMSVVVEHGDGVRLYCKGADSSILRRLAARDGAVAAEEKHVNEFAAMGLRTLCLAHRDLARADFDAWLQRWDEARSSMVNRDPKIEAVVAELEQELTLIGTTGVEDALQAGVPDTIEALRRGGMNVWVVTGDKQETAIQIANTCRLFGPGDEMLLLNSPMAKKAEKVPIAQAAEHERQCEAEVRDLIASRSATIDSGPESSWVLVVDGPTLAFCLHEEIRAEFVAMSLKCRAAVICRSTPFQKAQVVAAVKRECDVMTLAIGDGANDCSMIQMAHVGVGISGREGRQAVMASDFAIAQFQFLHRLLFVHGTWNYERVALLLQYFFFKNVMFNVVAFLYGFVSWWSGTIFMDQLLFLLYNFFFTSLPQIYAAVYDRPATARTLMTVPELYSRGRLDQGYNTRLFFAAVLEGAVCGALVFCIPFGATNGSQVAMLQLGQACLTLLIFVGNTYTLLNSWCLDRVQWLCQGLSLLAYLVFNAAYYSVPWVEFLEDSLGLSPTPLGIFTHTWGRGWFWAAVVVTFAMTTLARLFGMTAKRWFCPNDLQFAREREARGHAAVSPVAGAGAVGTFADDDAPVSPVVGEAAGFGFDVGDEGGGSGGGVVPAWMAPLKQNTML